MDTKQGGFRGAGGVAELERIVSIATNHIRRKTLVGSSVFVRTTPSGGDHSLLPQLVPALGDEEAQFEIRLSPGLEGPNPSD